MPNMPYVYAMEFIDVLKKKHAAKSYKEMVKWSVASELVCYKDTNCDYLQSFMLPHRLYMWRPVKVVAFLKV